MMALSDGKFMFDEIFDFQVDGSGRVHVGYSSDEPFNEPVDLGRQRINWGWSAGAGWHKEMLRQGSSIDDRPAWNGHMALDHDGRPYVLSLHTTHSVTGSMQTARLYYYRRVSENTWVRELVADSADGYVGGDGNKYTGEYPHLSFDEQNRPHVTFVDIASWHWECFPGASCNDQIRGQLRYAWKEGNTWKRFTLFSQDGQSASSDPLYLFESPLSVVTPGGSRVYAFGSRHVHFSNTVAYDPDAFVTYRVYLLVADNTLGSDPNLDLRGILLHILKLPVNSDNLDLNSDGVVDISDYLFGAQ